MRRLFHKISENATWPPISNCIESAKKVKRPMKVTPGSTGLRWPLALVYVVYLGAALSAGNERPKQLTDLSPADRQFQPKDLEADLEYLCHTIEAVHPYPYASTSRGVIAMERTEIVSKLTHPMSRLEFYRLLAPLVADFNDEHTTLFPPTEEALKGTSMIFPIRPIIWENRIFVRTNYSSNVNLRPGTEILSINGMSSPRLLDKLSRLGFGKNREYRMYMAERVFGVMLWAGPGFKSPFHLKISRDGKTFNESVEGVTKSVVRQKEAAENTTSHNTPYSFRVLDNERAALLEIRGFTEAKEIAPFLEQTFLEIKTRNVRAIIVDLRNNDGGFPFVSDLLLSYLTRKPVAQFSRAEVKVSVQSTECLMGASNIIDELPPSYRDEYFAELDATPGRMLTFQGNVVPPNPLALTGKLYVLTGRGTFSAASLLAAAIKDNRLGILIGKSTGGIGTAGPCPFELPRTKLTGTVAHVHWVLASGKSWDKGVDPDIVVPTKPRDILSGKDPVLENVLALIHSERDN